MLMQPGSMPEPARKRLNGILASLGAGYPSREAAQSAPASSGVITLTGYAEPGDGGGGVYLGVEAEPTYPGSYFPASDGGFWLYLPDARGVNAKAFGAVDDGVVGAGRTFTGTDNATSIQQAIDYALYSAKVPAYLPCRDTGNYRISKTIQHGYGANTRGGTLEGDGPKRRGESANSGTAILADFSAGPAIAINGARSSRVRRLSVMGQNYGWIEDNALMGPDPDVDDLVMANWLDPDLDPDMNARHTPYAAFAIDPYAGAEPADHYPDVTFPAWTGISTQYGKEPSSYVVFEDVYVGGFAGVAAIQPNADANGDFIKFVRVQGEYCAWILSPGNSQGRVVITENCSFARFHTGIINNVHGAQVGQLDLISISTDWEVAVQLFDIGDATAIGSTVFLGGYGETLWRIGNWGADSSDINPLSFTGFTFNFTAQTDRRGYPAEIFSCAAPAVVKFDTCYFKGAPKVMQFGGDAIGYSFDNCISTVEAVSNTYERLALNVLGGGFMFDPSSRDRRPERFGLKVSRVYDIDAGTSAPDYYKASTYSDRSHPVCAWTQRARARQQPGYAVETPDLWSAVAAASGTISSKSRSGATLTIAFTGARTAAVFARSGGLPGDLIWHDASKSLFAVRSQSGGTVLAELWNNYRIVGGSFDADGMSTGGGTVTPIDTIDLTSGSFYFGNGRVYLPEYFLRGDPSTGSATISNCARDDGFSDWLTDDSAIVAGDYVFIDELRDRWLSSANALITAVDGPAKTITVNAAPARSSTLKPLGFFIRQPPANV